MKARARWLTTCCGVAWTALLGCTSDRRDAGTEGRAAATTAPQTDLVDAPPTNAPRGLAPSPNPILFHPLDNSGLAPLPLDPSLPADDALVAPGEQRNAQIAGGESLFLAVWEDDRDGVTSLYAARLDATGGVLDKGGLRLATGPVTSAHVAFDGTTFVVAWSTGVEIRTTTVEPATGTVGDAKVVATGGALRVVGMAAGPGAIGLVTRGHSEIVGEDEYAVVRLTSNGVNVHSFGATTGTPGIGYCGDRFFLALSLALDAKLRLYEFPAAATGPSDTKVSFAAAFAQDVAVACRNKDVLVAWEESGGANAPVQSIKAQRPFAPTPGATTLSMAGGQPSGPTAAVLGSGFAVGWQDALKSTSEVAFVGVELAPPSELFSFMRAPKLATNRPAKVGSEDALVVFHDWWTPGHPAPATGTEVRVAPLGAAVVEPYLVSSQPNAQGEIALASTGLADVAVWTDYRYRGGLGDPTRLLLGDNGLPTTSAESLVSEPSELGNSREPAIAAFNGVWLAAWSTKGTKGTTLQLATGTGHALGSTAVLSSGVALLPRNPSIAATANSFLVAYEEGVELCTTSCAYVPSTLGVTRVKAGGTDLALAATSELSGALPRNPFVGPTQNGDALVVWERDGDLFAATALDGELPEKVPPTPMLALTGRQSRPRFAFRQDANQGLLVWEDESSNGKRIMACLIDASGTTIGARVVVSGTLASVRPVVLVHGGKYLLAWEGSEAGGVAQIYSAAVQFDGITVDAEPQRLSALALDDASPAAPALDALDPSYAPALIQSSTGGLLLAYEQQIRTLGTRRVVAIELPAETALGGTCGESSECGSRFCVDGVCCESACAGTCMDCSGVAAPDGPASAGKCLPVTLGTDETCTGAFRCAADGACMHAEGETCSTSAECASGVCANAPTTDDAKRQGICCNRACEGSCESCSEPLSRGQCVTAECGAFDCVVANDITGSKQCLDRCEDSSQCAVGNQCVAGNCLTATPAEQTVPGCTCSVVRRDDRCATRWLGVAALVAASTHRRRRTPRGTLHP